MEENIYKSPESNLESPSDVGNNTFKDSKFKKTIVMNFVGGIGLLIIFIFLIFSVFLSSSKFYSSGVILFYGFMTFTAFASAYTIKTAAKTNFQMVILIINWIIVVFVIIFLVGSIALMFSKTSSVGMFFAAQIVAVLLFLIPQVINIRAYRVLRNSTGNSQRV
jgi:cation transport ATPase